MSKEKITESCRVFILNRIDEIQKFMNSGKSVLDIFNYYQDIYDLRWKDYPTFGEYIRKSGLTFSKEALVILLMFFIYIYFMVGKLPFAIATFIALSAILIFVNFEKSWKRILKMVVISACATGAIILVFQVIFKVPMP